MSTGIPSNPANIYNYASHQQIDGSRPAGENGTVTVYTVPAGYVAFVKMLGVAVTGFGSDTWSVSATNNSDGSSASVSGVGAGFDNRTVISPRDWGYARRFYNMSGQGVGTLASGSGTIGAFGSNNGGTNLGGWVQLFAGDTVQTTTSGFDGDNALLYRFQLVLYAVE